MIDEYDDDPIVVVLDPSPIVSITVPGIQGPPGPPGPAGSSSGAIVSFVQATPAATWTISHNFGRYPASVLVVVGDELVECDVEFPDLNTAVLTFPAPVAGRVNIS